MKKLDFGHTITILANVGVIAGIVFLGYEMRQNTTALRSTGAQNINNQIAAINELRMNPDYVELILKGNEYPEDLSPVERVQYYAYLSTIVHAWQNMFTQMREGAYSEEALSGWWRTLRNNFQWPGFTQYWEGNAFVFSPEFRRFVEEDVMDINPDADYTERWGGARE